MTNHDLTLSEIYAARRRIAGHVRRTFLHPSPSLSGRTGSGVLLKLEHQQISGSFKVRGATNAVLSLSDDERRRGVVGVSTGNHGRGLAYACRAMGVRCVICMSGLVPSNKVDAIKDLGAEIHITGRSQDEAEVEMTRLVDEEGMVALPPFDNRAIIAGQGTLGLELLEEVPDLASVIVPLSGGGLVSGIALAIKAARPDAKIIGVSMERGAAMYASQRAGQPIQVDELPTLADALGGGIGLQNRFTFTMVRSLVDEIVLLTEAEIAAAISHAYWREQQVVEGSGAVGIGALLAGKATPPRPSIVIVSGGNIDLEQHRRIVSGEYSSS